MTYPKEITSVNFSYIRLPKLSQDHNSMYFRAWKQMNRLKSQKVEEFKEIIAYIKDY